MKLTRRKLFEGMGALTLGASVRSLAGYRKNWRRCSRHSHKVEPAPLQLAGTLSP